jgi:hypothetical protein
MAPPDQGSGASPPAATALRRQTSCTSSSRRRPDEPPARVERRLSCSSASFSSSSPAASPAPSCASSTTIYHLAASSTKSSCESIPFAADPWLLQPSSASSYESGFFTDHDDDCSKYLDFEPPAVQAMTAAAAASCYDPKRLPSAMFRTRSTNPAEWSVTSNESLFSIRLSSSGDVSDLYYDAAGCPRFPSMGSSSNASSRMMRMPSVSETEGGNGGLCLRKDCARCSAVTKFVRFAATAEVVSGGSKHCAVSPAYVWSLHLSLSCLALAFVRLCHRTDMQKFAGFNLQARDRAGPGSGVDGNDAGGNVRVVPIPVLLASLLLLLRLPPLRSCNVHVNDLAYKCRWINFGSRALCAASKFRLLECKSTTIGPSPPLSFNSNHASSILPRLPPLAILFSLSLPLALTQNKCGEKELAS